MYKRAIIVDDDNIKLNNIKRDILSYDDEIEIVEFEAGNPALRYLYNELPENERKDTILFLDWNFPNLYGDMPKRNGDLFIQRMYHHNVEVDTVIVSSNNVSFDDDEDILFVKGSILYDSSLYMYDEFAHYLSMEK